MMAENTSSDRPERRVPLTKPSFGDEEERLLLETLRSGWVAQGPRVAELEQRQLQNLHRLDHLRRLHESLLQAGGLMEA